MSRTVSLALIVAVFILPLVTAEAAPRRAGSAGASAQDGALVGLHELRREGGKVCMAEHTHVGASTGQPSRKAAEVVAQSEWSSFTAFEYGGHWGSVAMAGSKTMKCSGSANSYSCQFEARPCRRG